MKERTRRAQVGLAVAHAGVLHLHAHVVARLVPAGQGKLHLVQSGQTCNFSCAAVARQCMLALACKGRVLYASHIPTAKIPGFTEVPIAPVRWSHWMGASSQDFRGGVGPAQGLIQVLLGDGPALDGGHLGQHQSSMQPLIIWLRLWTTSLPSRATTLGKP